RPDDRDSDSIQHVQPVCAGEARDEGEGKEKDDHADDRPHRVEDPFVATVADPEPTAFHDQTRTISTFPKRPYGRNMRMITSATNGATSFTPPPRMGSRYPPERFSSTPISTPPMIAPGTLSRPPRITTGKTFRPRSASEKSTPPRTLPRMIPPSADTTVAMHHDSAKIRLTLTPSESATCWLSAVARIAMPVVEKRKNTEKPASSAMTTTKLQRCTGDTGTGPR